MKTAERIFEDEEFDFTTLGALGAVEWSVSAEDADMEESIRARVFPDGSVLITSDDWGQEDAIASFPSRDAARKDGHILGEQMMAVPSAAPPENLGPPWHNVPDTRVFPYTPYEPGDDAGGWLDDD